MPAHHACIWLDHREAKIFAIEDDEVAEIVLHDAHLPKHIHRKSDHVHLGKAAPDHAFLNEIAGALGSFRAIVITGPGTARTELAGYLNEQFPLIAKRVWGTEAVDHPTDHQIIAAARKYFRAANRMHQ